MAWVEKRGQSYRLSFRFNEQMHRVNLKSRNRRDAEACRVRLEDNLLLVERGRLPVPSGAELGLFLHSDGKLEKQVEITRVPTLGEIIAHYHKTFTVRAKEEITRKMDDTPLAHLIRIIGRKRPLSEITTGIIQQFIDARSRETHRGQLQRVERYREWPDYARLHSRSGANDVTVCNSRCSFVPTCSIQSALCAV